MIETTIESWEGVRTELFLRTWIKYSYQGRGEVAYCDVPAVDAIHRAHVNHCSVSARIGIYDAGDVQAMVQDM